MTHPPKQTAFQKMAAQMADELESTRLVVALAPEKRRTCEGGKIRVVEQKNPEWYQRFCAQYTSARRLDVRSRKHKTAIKRIVTLRALRALASGRAPFCNGGTLQKPVYQQMLTPVIKAEMRAQKQRLDFERKSLLEGVPF